MKKTTKTRVTIATLLSTTLLTLLSAFVSLAWFINRAEAPSESDGSTLSSYFAYGNGTKEEPYGIKLPRHVYNLAWLQDLGYFNKDKDGDGKKDTVYFELAQDVDMSTLNTALPPIGTEANPFIGQFTSKQDGSTEGTERYTISNVNISNDFSDYKYHPGVVSSFGSTDSATSIKQPHIVGFFGVVGRMESQSLSYETSTNKIENFNLQSGTITSAVDTTLIGIVAGYVNGTVDNVGISENSSVSLTNTTKALYSTFEHISYYTSVGYCTDAYKDTIYRNITTISAPKVENKTFTAGEGDSGSGWGGSIDMLSAFNRLNGIYSHYTKNSGGSYQSDTYVIDPDGVKHTITTPITSTDSLYNSENYSSSKNSYDEKIGAYDFYAQSGTPFVFYLNGGHTESTITQDANSTTGECYLIYYDSSHYLSSNGIRIINSYSSSSAKKWQYYYETVSHSYYLRYIDNGIAYYLTRNGTNLSVTTKRSQATTWTLNGYLKDASANYYVYYDNSNGIWSVKTNNPNNGTNQSYYISSDGTYINLNGNNGITSSSTASTAWTLSYFDSTATSGTTTISNGTGTYLNYYKKYSYYYLHYLYYLTAGNNNWSFYYKKDIFGKYLIYYYPNSSQSYYKYYYLTYSSDTDTRWALTGTDDLPSSGNLTLTPVLKGANLNYSLTTGNVLLDTTSTAMDYSGTDVTYMPLNVNSTSSTFDSSSTNDSDYEASSKNTGYLLGGGNKYGNSYGNSRVSRYENSLYNYSSTSGLSGVKTVNSSNQIVTIDDDNNSYQKYSKSKEKMESVLSSSNDYIYGMHFLDAEISKDNLVTASYAMIEGTKKQNYTMPANCIDFDLREKGYINFFAGTYGSYSSSGQQDDCFFSLHQIFRDSKDTITDIKEIEAIYSDGVENHSYVYKYKTSDKSTLYSSPYQITRSGNVYLDDPTTSKPYTSSLTTSLHSGYSSVFNTSQLGIHTLDRYYAYYFEIPMNEGEFALGSVSGGTGAYLMYLDIGANAATIDRTKVSEIIASTHETFIIPKGVAIIGSSSDNVTNTDSACIVINKDYGSGETNTSVTVSRSANIISLTGYSDSLCQPSFIGATLSVTDSSGTTTYDAHPESSSTTKRYRITNYDYNHGTASVTKTVFDLAIDGNSNETITVKAYSVDSSGTETELTDIGTSADPIYTDGGKTITSTESSTINQYFFSSDDRASIENDCKDRVDLVYHYDYQDGTSSSSYTEDYQITFSEDSSGSSTQHFFAINGYTVVITKSDSSGQTVNVYIIKADKIYSFYAVGSETKETKTGGFTFHIKVGDVDNTIVDIRTPIQINP